MLHLPSREDILNSTTKVAKILSKVHGTLVTTKDQGL